MGTGKSNAKSCSFTENDYFTLAALIFKRFEFDIEAANAAWKRLFKDTELPEINFSELIVAPSPSEVESYQQQISLCFNRYHSKITLDPRFIEKCLSIGLSAETACEIRLKEMEGRLDLLSPLAYNQALDAIDKIIEQPFTRLPTVNTSIYPTVINCTFSPHWVES